MIRPYCIDINRKMICFGPAPDIEDLSILSNEFDGIVSLLRSEEYGFLGYGLDDVGKFFSNRFLWLPIPDKRAPLIYDPILLSRFIEDKSRVFIHCFGGLGRSPTLTTALLILKCMSHNDAVTKIRSIRRGAIETKEQLKYLERIELIKKAFYPYNMDRVLDILFKDIDRDRLFIIDRISQVCIDILNVLRNVCGYMVYDIKSLYIGILARLLDRDPSVLEELIDYRSLRIAKSIKSFSENLVLSMNSKDRKLVSISTAILEFLTCIDNYRGCIAYATHRFLGSKLRLYLYTLCNTVNSVCFDIVKNLAKNLNLEIEIELKSI